MWLNQTWAHYTSAKSEKVPKSGKDISCETTPDHFAVGPMATSHSKSGDMHEWPGPKMFSMLAEEGLVELATWCRVATFPQMRWKFQLFFQAEDGIRDVERSRGLGDVYKRQIW